MSLFVALAEASVPGPDLMPSFGRTALSMVVVVGLLALALWALKRHGPRLRGRQAMAIESALALGERRSLAIVSVEGRRLLVGLAPGQVSLVTELAPGARFADAVDHAVNASGAAEPRA